jgi:hypothetical protein
MLPGVRIGSRRNWSRPLDKASIGTGQGAYPVDDNGSGTLALDLARGAGLAGAPKTPLQMRTKPFQITGQLAALQ